MVYPSQLAWPVKLQVRRVVQSHKCTFLLVTMLHLLLLSADSGYLHPASSCISVPGHCAQETAARVLHDSTSLSQRSKTCTSLSDLGSASGNTFKCIFLAIFMYLFISVLLSSRSSPITRRHHEFQSEHFCTCYPQALKKVPRAKSGTFWFPRMNSHNSTTIFCSSCVALKYETGNKFFPLSDSQAIQHYRNHEIPALPREWCFLMSSSSNGWFYTTCRADESSLSFEVSKKAIRPPGEVVFQFCY